MARLLFNTTFRGLLNPTQSLMSKVASSGSVLQQGLRYSTAGDSDTHDDFKPTSKIERSGVSLQDVVKQDVVKNPVVIYMKGVPDAPRCGFSALAVKILQQYNVPITPRNILENPRLKEGVKAFSNWPTFPQVFIKGEFVGGSDIVLNMHQQGQLRELLADINADSSKQA
ncbi:uncharacterized protein A4U43_C08F7090 [Asparagus officinalis]|uniref:monothiol glutaredoxin-S15, mitochondrial isoform X2 n=1 Tax=Asparagus officinalis TaxID=4686 RepID=UPI00098E6FF6|nr:monothiol glutaredoxin-S15, mitochondrial isoform X2 [Asparagus officinalis]ONK59502.1 uncharacterized protein A4U43_C08F7090 [Asparagus officinalis]